MNTVFHRKSFTVLLFLSFGLTAQEYRLVWKEEFNTLDTAIWSFEQGLVRNREAQWYSAANAFVQDGMLIIEARKDTITNPNYDPNSGDWRRRRQKSLYTSASLNTARSHDFLYGRFEIRAKIPTAGGAWPAIWMLGREMPWPSCGEIDIMEYYRINGEPHLLANAAWGNDRPFEAVWNTGKKTFAHFEDRDPLWSQRFHVWRMDWDPMWIRIYLDDELMNEIALKETINGAIGNFSNPFHQPHYLLLNLALGGDNGGEVDPSMFPLRFEIDYVRVFQRL